MAGTIRPTTTIFTASLQVQGNSMELVIGFFIGLAVATIWYGYQEEKRRTRAARKHRDLTMARTPKPKAKDPNLFAWSHEAQLADRITKINRGQR